MKNPNWLTVKKLKEELNKYDDDTVIAVYVQEDMDVAREVRLESRDEDKRSYCKSDHVLDYRLVKCL